MFTPGPIMSGFKISGTTVLGPRELNAATTGDGRTPRTVPPKLSIAMGLPPPRAAYSRILSPTARPTATAGSRWLSATSSSPLAAVFASIMPAPPAAPVADEAAVDYEALARELEGASPLEIMDRALAMFGSEIAIAFRYVTSSLVPLLNRDGFGSGTRYRVPVSLRYRWSSWNGFRRGDLHPACSRHRGIFRTCGRTRSKWTRAFRWPLNCVSHLSASETARDH